ncbi:GNAT family N-acetyltransferase [Aestuariispira insulae]|uniref:GNAT family acetyltransferase n=1 Tax=Aestuariispira insulae TaxID=1461337 RepID=A0A3D9H694_9PROT|nr:GNAT family N-acetyltransferase [Aestuariispira insulae]RED45037.1 GNAT family acetyltransferase [Aestuariispira insulae]
MAKPPVIHLLPMTPSYYANWLDHAIQSFADDKQRTHGYAPDQARKLANDSITGLLPDGPETKDQHLYMVQEETGTPIGHAWLAMKDDYGLRRGFIYEIEILDNFQGNGFGRATMQALEETARALGAEALGLHVFSFNQPAQNLYRSLGFDVTGLSMEKAL